MNKLKKGLAEKMFEDLGYKRHDEYSENICSYIEYFKNPYNVIIFYNGYLDKTFEKTSSECSEIPDNITIDEYKAITQQLRELKWISF